MTNFLKLKLLILMIAISALAAFSTELSAYCKIDQVVKNLPKCSGWPFLKAKGSNTDDCIDCIGDLERKCKELGVPLFDEEYNRLYDHCLSLEESMTRTGKASPLPKSNTP